MMEPMDSNSPEETTETGRRFGVLLQPGHVLALIGDLGAGKTQFVKGVASGLGIDPKLVTSPTFVLMNGYEGRIPLRHYDFYRPDSVDLEALGFFDVIRDSAVVVEWADKAGDKLGERLEIVFETTGLRSRRLTFCPVGAAGNGLFERFRNEPSGAGLR